MRFAFRSFARGRTPLRPISYLLAAALAACGGGDPAKTGGLASDPRDNRGEWGDGDTSSEEGDDSEGDSGDGDSGDDDADDGPYYGAPQEREDSPREVSGELPVSPFVDASKDPFSTFAADVDTASYDYFRQAIQNGALPSAEYVRAGDFVDYFAYDYETPAFDAEHPFAIDLAAGVHPLGRASTLLRVGIQAKAPPPAEKKPVNLVYLVDVSGSMASANKLPLAKVVMKESLATLAATDTVSIVSYASDTRVRLGPTAVSERATIEAAINDLQSGGGTNGASGINLAYEQASAGFLQEGINHVILCTDGDFNLGVTSNDALVALIREKRASGVTLTALGFGNDNLNDSMMEKVSNAGNGIYSVIYSQDQAIEYANERLLGTVFHVAKDMKIQVEFNPAKVRAYRLIGYENRAIADDDFRDDSVDAGEVGAGRRVTALYEVVLAGEELSLPPDAPALSPGESAALTPEIAADEIVRVKVRYKAPGATDADPASEVVGSLLPDAIVADAQSVDPDLAWAAAVSAFAERLRSSPFARPEELARIGEIVEAQKTIDGDRGEFASSFVVARGYLEGE